MNLLNKAPKYFFVLGSFKLGGTERTASRIGMELIKQGYNIKFILINGVFDYKEKVLKDNSIVLVKDKTKHKIWRLFGALFMLMKILRREKPMYLVSFSLGINLFIFFTFYGRMIFRIESNIFIYKKKLYRRYIQKLISISPNVKKVVVPSKGLYEKCQSYFFLPGKLVQIPNPVSVSSLLYDAQESLNDFPELEENKFIVSAGRLNASKGFEQLIKVFAKSRLRDKFKLVILGDGSLRKLLEKLIWGLQMQDNIVLAGYQVNPNRFFFRAKYFILNSAHESFGNVLIESMACGIPVVSNNCDFGPRYIIKNNYNGVLYNRDDENEFIEVIEKVAFDEAFYIQLKNGALKERDKYDIPTITDFWIHNILN